MASISTAVPPTTTDQEVVPSSIAQTTVVRTTETPEPSTTAVASSAVLSSAVVVPSSSSITSAVESSIAAPSSSAISSAVPTTSATPSPSPIPSPSPSPSTEPTTRVVTVTSVSQPGLVIPSSIASRTTSVSAGPATQTEGGKGGIGGSGLPLGGLIGIIVGALAIIVVVGLIVTRSMRKRARAKRTANRSSMFEPWPAPVAMEDEPYEKPEFDSAAAQTYPMHASSEPYHDNAYPASYGHDQNAPIGYNNAAYPGYGEYPPQPYGQAPYPGHVSPEMAGAAGGVVGAGVAASNAEHGVIPDGSMVRVKVAFVRSLEDELAITPGQQLYLHTAYDDGWTLCEDQAQNRGVVPLSCLELWDETQGDGLVNSVSTQSLAPDATTKRRSSLYQPPQ